MLYFSLRRLEFETSVEDNTNGRFHVLTLVDGERIRIRSIEHPERYFDAEFMDMVVVPADMGCYVIENLRTEPDLRAQNHAQRWIRRRITGNCFSMSEGRFSKPSSPTENGRFVPDTEYSVPMPSDGPREEIEQALIARRERGMRSAAGPRPADRMHGNRLPRPVRLRTRHSADDAQIPEHIRHIAARPAPHTYGCGTDDARSVHARRERRDAGRKALRKRPGLRHAALIALGTGLGFACCLDGEVQYAPTGSPRITVYKKPFRDGILEDYVAKRGFLRLYGEITGQDTGPSLTVADLGRMAGEGNPAARETFATIGRMLGEALRELIRKERIECLLLGGQISRSYAYLEPGLRKGLYGTACLRSIAPAAHIGHAAFYGLLARLDGLRPET